LLVVVDCFFAYSMDRGDPDGAHAHFPTEGAGDDGLEPSSHVPQWCTCGGSPPELARRTAVLHRVCCRLLAIRPSHRPRTISALQHTLRRSLVVRTYTVQPILLARAIDAPSDVQCKLDRPPLCAMNMLEPPPEALVRYARMTLERLALKSLAAAQWLASQAVVSQAYSISEVVDVLVELALLVRGDGAAIDCTSLTRDTCYRVLPIVLDFPSEDWFFGQKARTSVMVARVVPLPVGCTAAALIGKGGVAINALRRHLEDEFSDASTLPSVRLVVGGATLNVSVRLQGAPQTKATTVADAMVTCVAQHCSKIQQQLSRQRQAKREQQEHLRKCFQVSGQLYHVSLRRQRSERRDAALESVGRALALPFSDTRQELPSAFRLFKAHPTKARFRCRRQAWVREKRRTLLRAAATLDRSRRSWRGSLPAVATASSLEAAGQPSLFGVGDLQRCGQLLSKSHISDLCVMYARPHFRMQTMPTPNRHVASAARRMLRHLDVATKAMGGELAPVPWPLPPSGLRGRCARKQDTASVIRGRGGRRCKLHRSDMTAEVAEGLAAFD